MKASVSKIESFSTVDGPGIRTTVFFNGCALRCKFCHNPEMWEQGEDNYTVDELFEKIIRNKPYFGENGGVTFSGGEPALNSEFLIELCGKLRTENIHIALDTAGVAFGGEEELLKAVDLILFDIKGLDPAGYEDITQRDYFAKAEEFIDKMNVSGKEVWIRQVIIPGINDNEEYIAGLAKYLRKIKNITNIELLPFHTMAFGKYEELGLDNPYKEIMAMDRERCKELEKSLKQKYFIK